MAISFSYCNPLRFQKRYYDNINYTTRYPTLDRMKYRTDYQRGVNAVPNLYPVIPLGKSVTLQVNDTGSITSAYATNINSGATNNLTITDVTPSGWVSGNIFNLTLDTSVLFYGEIHNITLVSSTSGQFVTDEFLITYAPTLSDIVEIQCYDSDNRYDGVFTDGTSWIWQPIKYFTGQYIQGGGGNEYSIFNQSNGVPIKVDANPTRTRIINLAEISQLEMDILNSMLSCDNILINGESVQNPEGYEFNPVDNSDVCNPVINVTLVDNGNSNKFS